MTLWIPFGYFEYVSSIDESAVLKERVEETQQETDYGAGFLKIITKYLGRWRPVELQHKGHPKENYERMDGFALCAHLIKP
jgi:hypothetical protein